VSAEDLVDGVPDAVGLVDSARRHLERVIDHDAALAPMAEALQSAGFLLADAATELAGYLAGLDADGARELEIVQERRALIIGLVRRHGGTLDDVLEFRRTGGLRLVELDGDDDRIEGSSPPWPVSPPRSTASRPGSPSCAPTAAARLADAVTAELAALAMPDARLTVSVDAGARAHHARPRPGRDPPASAPGRPSRGRSRAAPPAVSSRG
jgi:DNA repair protein RecN (Recombination protein N)